jgi:hypothetical protein
MGSALLTGRWHEAWQHNPVLLVGCGLLAIRTVGWLIEWRRHPGASTGQRWLPATWSRHWLPLATVGGLIYGLVRNL